MKTALKKIIIKAFLMLNILCLLTSASGANTRILESEFRLSRQTNSEFSAKFSTYSPGKITVEASCQKASAKQTRLRLVLIRPDKTEIKTEGISPLKVEHLLTTQDLDGLLTRRAAQWTAKIINLENTGDPAIPIVGTLKITVPTSARRLEDTQFTLQGNPL